MSDNNKITKVQVDKDSCLGCGTCVVIDPEAFELGADSKSSVREGALKSGDEALLMVAQSCPVSAISLYDSDGNQIFPLKRSRR